MTADRISEPVLLESLKAPKQVKHLDDIVPNSVVLVVRGGGLFDCISVKTVERICATPDGRKHLDGVRITSGQWDIKRIEHDWLKIKSHSRLPEKLGAGCYFHYMIYEAEILAGKVYSTG